jgi:hypothetical protein
MFIEFLPPSPKAGIKEHVSIETGKALIAAGFARLTRVSDADHVPDKDDVIPPKPPRGWETGFITWGDERKLVIIFHDGQGGRMVYDGPPVEKRWVDARENGRLGHYVNVAIECPADVIAQFHTLAGNHKEAVIAREKAEREALQNAREAADRNKHGRFDAQVLAARLSK